MQTEHAGALVDRVRAELARYEHPLFAFDAQAKGDAVEVEINFKLPQPQFDPYKFELQPREIQHPQFTWTFQRQLYDCLHDYVIEMFASNPQRKE
jgi:hypothetical protein